MAAATQNRRTWVIVSGVGECLEDEPAGRDRRLSSVQAFELGDALFGEAASDLAIWLSGWAKSAWPGRLGDSQGKLLREKIVSTDSVPWVVLRATQFHEFALQLLDRPEAGGRDAIDGHAAHRSGEVAGALVGLAECEPRGMAPQVTGPWVESMVDVMRRLLRAGGSRLAVLSPRLQGAAFAEMASGDLLPTKPGDRGSQSWDE